MNNSILKSFRISGLFDEFDVDLPLNNKVNIFLGENGIGKTTILNCLYCALSGKLERLNSILFKDITLTFNDNTQLTVAHEDIVAYEEDYVGSKILRKRIDFASLFTRKEIEELVQINFKDIDDATRRRYYVKLMEEYDMHIPLRVFEQELERFYFYTLYKQKGDYKKVLQFKNTIEKRITNEILYFPTYRRIEEDISKLGIDLNKDSIKDKLIQFGMTDVKSIIDKLLEKIKALAITSFNKMTGVLLRQYLDERLVSTDYEVDFEKLNIALDRLGEEIDEKDKLKIKELANTTKLYNNGYLLNLIENLINSYEKQHSYDEKVKKFVEVCNKYLNNKKYIYDESKVELGIHRERSKTAISIQNLSSGEKQIISMFSKLYLSEMEKCIILFDEPELSLSIKWQSSYLPDIMKSERCETLIAVTHSPFIFDNEYDSYAQDIQRCIVERG